MRKGLARQPQARGLESGKQSPCCVILWVMSVQETEWGQQASVQWQGGGGDTLGCTAENKLGIALYIFNPSTRDVEAGGSRLHRPFSKKKKKLTVYRRRAKGLMG